MNAAAGAATNHDQVMLALVSVLGVAVAALAYVIKSYRQVRDVNAAINNVGPGEHRLYDKVTSIASAVDHLVATQEAFAQKGWASLPADIGDAPALTETIRRLQAADAEVQTKLDQILSELAQHIEWEMAEKYGSHGDTPT